MRTQFFPLPDDYASRAWLATAMFMFALLFALAPAPLFDARMLNGAGVWWKPMKFCLSLGVHFITLAVLAQLLAPAARRGALLRVAVVASVAAALLEIVYIAVQAARGRHSHFNYDTAFESTMYAAMGVGALLLVLAPAILGLMLAFQRDGDRSGLKLGAVLGLLLGAALTLVFAGYMSSSGSHFVGAPDHSDANGLPLFGWSTEVGDLRPAHFVATHMMQTLPLAGWAADRLAPKTARAAVLATAVILGGLAAALFGLALAGRPAFAFAG